MSVERSYNIRLYIYYKLAKLRNKYPKDTKLIEQLVLVAFRNNGKIPKETFKLAGWGYRHEDLLKILKEFNIHPEDIDIFSEMSNCYSKNEVTVIHFKKPLP